MLSYLRNRFEFLVNSEANLNLLDVFAFYTQHRRDIDQALLCIG